MSRYVMRFIGGKYEGGVVHLPEAGEVGIGRAQELEICLVEDMVSRHHAKLEVHADKVILTDLGSTNGTFVNGERIKMCELEHDDRVLFGTSILRLEDTQPEGHTSAEAETEAKAATVATQVVQTEAMSGDLTDVGLADILQLLGGNSRSGVLTLSSPDGTADVAFVGGTIEHISAAHWPTMAPVKVLCRMLAWTEGQFVFADGETRPPSPGAPLGRAEGLLMEAARQNDESARLWQTLGGHDSFVGLARPLGGPLHALDRKSLEALQLVWDESGALQQMADVYPGEDSVLLHAIDTLMQDGFIQPMPSRG